MGGNSSLSAVMIASDPPNCGGYKNYLLGELAFFEPMWGWANPENVRAEDLGSLNVTFR